jgi:hypothetical protein
MPEHYHNSFLIGIILTVLPGELQNLFEGFGGFEGVGKVILTALGMACLIVGIAGLILPLLPGTPFLLLSSLCFLAVS